MYSKKGVVYKLHARWFINRTPGDFGNWGLFNKFRGLLFGNPTEGAESLILISGRQAVYKSNPGTATVCRRRGASGQEKNTRHQVIVRCGCDSDTDSNRAMPTARETSKTQTLRNTGPFSSPTSPCW